MRKIALGLIPSILPFVVFLVLWLPQGSAQELRDPKAVTEELRFLAEGLPDLSRSPSPTASGKDRIRHVAPRRGPAFHPNRGQYPASVLYIGRSEGLLVAIERDAIQLVPPNSDLGQALSSDGRAPIQLTLPQNPSLGIRWIGTSTGVQVIGEGQTEERVSTFLGSDPAHWIADSPAYERVRFRGLYEGIDLIVYDNGGALEFDYEILPGADPAQIRWKPVSQAVILNHDDGTLAYSLGHAELRVNPPVAFQPRPQTDPPEEMASIRKWPIAADYHCGADRTCRFQLGSYDPARPLVIDPVLLYSSYYGGAFADQANVVVTDTAGNVYLIGETWSSGLTTVNGVQLERKAGKDVFVIKFNSTGKVVVNSSYLGGSGDDIPTAARIVGSDLMIAGETTSSDLPGTSGYYQASLRGNREGFVGRIRFGAPSTLVGVTYLGGSASDRISALTTDLAGNVYLAGYTASSDFPVTVPSFGTGFAGGTSDAFLSRLSPDLTALHWSGVLGGSGSDRADALALGSGDSIWIAGTTSSSNLPTLNAVQPGLLGSYDCFLARTSNDGQTLQFSSYLGGSNSDNCYALAVAPNGDPVVAGSSSSPDFPITAGAFQPARSGSYDNVVTRVDAQTNMLGFSTYLGGFQTEAPNTIYMDTDGAFCLAGYTLSTNFPVLAPIQPASGGSVDGFLSCLGSTGTNLLFSTYLGGSGEDRVQSVARRADTWTIAAGVTYSTNFPVTSDAQQSTARSSGDYFLTAINRTGANVAPSNVSVTPSNGSTETASLTYLIEDKNGYQDVKYFYSLIHNAVSTVGGCYSMYNPDLNLLYLLSDDGRYWVGSATPGENKTLANNQCNIDASKSSVWAHATRMSIQLFYAFRPGFGGAKSLLMYTQDRANIVAGWQLRGGWSVPQLAGNVQPSVDYLAPNNGSFLSTAFVVRAVDQNGANDLKDLHLLVNDSLTYPNSCYVLYNQDTNSLKLLNDSTSQFLGPVTPGVAGSLENSSCILSGAYSSAAKSGNTLTLTAYLSFKAAAGGTNNLWTLVSDHSNSFLGWRSQGSITVPFGGAYAKPGVQSATVTPVDTKRRIILNATDENGGYDIKDLYFLANATLTNPNGCYVLLRRSTNQAFLLNDTGTAWAGSGTIGSASILQNSQCRLELSSITISEVGTSVQATADITFLPAFTGAKSLWMYAEDYSKLASGWVYATGFSIPAA